MRCDLIIICYIYDGILIVLLCCIIERSVQDSSWEEQIHLLWMPFDIFDVSEYQLVMLDSLLEFCRYIFKVADGEVQFRN